MISDAAAISVDVVTLFGNLEALYLLFTRSPKVHGLFEDVPIKATGMCYPFPQATKYSSMECTGNVLVYFSRAL